MARETVAGHRLPGAEAEVLRLLLGARGPLLVSEIQQRLPGQRAHTTVATLLTRLCDRGLVTREERGRGHAYRAAGSEQELALTALQRVVDDLDNPAAALVAFVDQLPAPTRRSVTRRLLGRTDRR